MYLFTSLLGTSNKFCSVNKNIVYNFTITILMLCLLPYLYFRHLYLFNDHLINQWRHWAWWRSVKTISELKLIVVKSYFRQYLDIHISFIFLRNVLINGWITRLHPTLIKNNEWVSGSKNFQLFQVRKYKTYVWRFGRGCCVSVLLDCISSHLFVVNGTF